ncbi:MAG: hypothetical protein ACR2QC_11330 [Gammaproteobacteria bacterium]
MRFPRSREWHEGERGNPSTQKFHSCTTPSHSCEGRNLRRRKAAGNCNSCNLQFAPSARRFLPSQEWDGGQERNRGEN